jgi:hypothetical protein
VEPKSISLAFDYLVGEDYDFGELTILFDFWLDKGAIIELPRLAKIMPSAN